MRRLVALDLPGGPRFADEVRRVWDAGDAVAVLDRRLPAAARSAWLEAVRPHTVISGGPGGVERHLVDGAAPEVDDGDALVVTTSGSTGTPKVLVHTLDGLRSHARAVHSRLGVDRDRDRWLACLPLAHLGGFGVLARSILTDTPCDVDDRFDAEAVAVAPFERGSTLVSLVPTALDRLEQIRRPDPGVGSDAIPTHDFGWIVLGGSGDTKPRGANAMHTYGLTETGGGVVYGGVPLPGVEVRVGEDGTIGLRGPMLARGLRAPDGSVTPVADADGWLVTGDLGRWRPDPIDPRSDLCIDPDGPADPRSSRRSGPRRSGVSFAGQDLGSDRRYLWVDGRADDLILTGGENVWPTVVEAAVATHPGVAEAAVVGRPDPEWGTVVVAVVVPADAADPPSLEEIRAHVRLTLPPHAAPKCLVIAGSLPRTALGKVRRGDLPTL